MLTEDILSWTHNVLKTTPDRWMDLTSDLPAGLLTRPPAPGEWSALECLQHLVEEMIKSTTGGYSNDPHNPKKTGK